jgi:hypothetical protein
MERTKLMEIKTIKIDFETKYFLFTGTAVPRTQRIQDYYVYTCFTT